MNQPSNRKDKALYPPISTYNLPQRSRNSWHKLTVLLIITALLLTLMAAMSGTSKAAATYPPGPTFVQNPSGAIQHINVYANRLIQPSI